MISRTSLLVLGGLALAAPGLRAADADEKAEAARVVLRRYCVECHDGPENKVKSDLEILDRGLLVRRKLVRPGEPDASELLQLMDVGSEPPGDLAKPQAAELQALRDWILAGAPPFPAETGEPYVLGQILADLKKLDKADLRFQRYLSFNHLLAAGPLDVVLYRDALLKALNHLSSNPKPAAVVAIDPTGTIFRIDLRQLGWDDKPFVIGKNTPAAAPGPLNLFDLLLLEYPYGVLTERFSGERKPLGNFLRKAEQVRPIVYVRADWLVGTATQPPLYEDLLGLPRSLEKLEEKIGAEGKGARAGFLGAGATHGDRLVERRNSRDGAYWRTLDVGPVKALNDLVRNAEEEGVDHGGLAIFSLPNGLNGYYIAEKAPDVDKKFQVRLAAAAPPEEASDPLAPDRVARNGLSCLRCHDGVKPVADAVHPALDALPKAAAARLAPFYPGQDKLDAFLKEDLDRYQKAVRAVHGRPLDREPLTPVTQRFLKAAGANLPAPAPALAAANDDHGPARLLHLPFADKDSAPLLPLDGLTRPDYRPTFPAIDVTMTVRNAKTGQETTAFSPGEEMEIHLTNQGKQDVFFELVNVLSDGGKMLIQEPMRKLGPGEIYKYPRQRSAKPKPSVKMDLPPGKDQYILFASDAKFPDGVRMQAARDGEVADRVVHPFYELNADGDVVPRFDPARLIKKAVEIVTLDH